MRDAFVSVLSELAANDPSVLLITGDLGFGVLTEFSKNFPNQFVNAGVAEQNMTSIACGAALSGRKVYTYSIANFTTLRCLEQIRNDVCYHKANVTIVSVGGGFSYGQLGMSHFATEDIAILRALPELLVLAPTEVWETEDLARELATHDGPAYIRLDKGRGGSERRPGEVARIGKARRVKNGDAYTIVATGAILAEALDAANLFENEGISIRVLAVHTIKPLDREELLYASRETGGILTIEEHTTLGGLGGAVAEVLLEADVMPRSFSRMGLNDEFPTIVGDQNFLRKHHGLDSTSIVERIREKFRK